MRGKNRRHGGQKPGGEKEKKTDRRGKARRREGKKTRR